MHTDVLQCLVSHGLVGIRYGECIVQTPPSENHVSSSIPVVCWLKPLSVSIVSSAAGKRAHATELAPVARSNVRWTRCRRLAGTARRRRRHQVRCYRARIGVRCDRARSCAPCVRQHRLEEGNAWQEIPDTRGETILMLLAKSATIDRNTLRK